MNIKARITVTLKNGVLDPQGQAIRQALNSLDFPGIGSVRQGKVFDITLEDTSEPDAEKLLQDMCEKLLANTVIEDYTVRIIR